MDAAPATETTTQHEPAPELEQHQEHAAPAPVVELDERRPKTRKARDPERRRAEAEAEAVRRALRKAVRARDFEALSTLRGAATGATTGTQRSTPTHAAAEAPAPAPVAVAPLSPAPAPSRGAAWPAESEVDGWRAIVAPLVGVAAAQLVGTRYELGAEEVEFTLAGQKVRTSKPEALTDAFSTLAAKYLPANLATPEAYAAAVVFAVFGGPALGHALERVTAARERAGAGTEAPSA